MCECKRVFRYGVLRDLRKKRGWSQKDLAKAAGVSNRSISQWEIGATIPNTKNIRSLCAVFGLKEEDLCHTSNIIVNDDTENNTVDICPELEERVEKLEALMASYISKLESFNRALLQVQDQECTYYERLTEINKEITLLKHSRGGLFTDLLRKALS